ncbi:6-phosphofructokinase [Engelhardtia mirabilis]|uniref:Pyrophosphate--fructose 6-phosphate 1-phosphotransferase n=1 Tax=Engelhardtia mirabilis TaxID=2528011 RepID=A0A518BNX5_9BACT|nr:Pyrophosphate--fructose 6-phosphate 1-phosphotransferase [Planctomycetes bacterium Pla133]QDV03006.1 Pyrophosphate--fructose 6-phosphate 1-phosphotransferase [Planctomycetes bacterium Pla86]
MANATGNVLIGQSGGPTAVINQSLIGIVEQAVANPAMGRVFGAVHGVRGILDDDLIDLGAESRETLEAVANTPCAALRSVRKKPTRGEGEKVLAAFERHDIRYFFYIGGNDSAETAHLLNELAVEKGYDVKLFHVPKTIDNDLRVTDHCPGYGSAARFVAQAFMGDNQDNRSLPGIKVDVVMGRNAGWLTASSALARQFSDDGPHLIYMPERDFDLERFAGDVDRVYSDLGRCLIAVSEGIHGPGGELIFKTDEVDSHGNAQLSGSGALGDFLAGAIKQRLGSSLRVRADTFGYLQRSFAGLVSEVDAAEAREVGRTAVRVATDGEHQHGTVVIRRTSQEPYEVAYEVAALSDVAKNTRDLPEEFLLGDNDVSPAFLDYALPLVGKLPRMGRLTDRSIG